MQHRSHAGFAGILLFAAGSLVVGAGCAAASDAPWLAGRVTDTGGKPVSGVMITLESAEMAPTTLTVFSDDTGAYAMPTPQRPTPPEETSLAFKKVGYATKRRPGPPVAGGSRVDVTLEPTDDVAGEVPASAWLQDLPDTQARERMVLLCGACHQFPLEIQRQTAASMQDRTEAEREAAWHEVFTRMRPYFLTTTFPEGTAFDPEKLPPGAAEQMGYMLLTREDEEAVVPFLAEHFPQDLSRFPLAKLRPGAPLGAGKGTVVREYPLPIGSHVREVAFAKGSPYLWGADLKKNRMLRLDLEDGSQKWFRYPAQGATGPHTIAADAEGNLWVTAQENDLVARFDPREERWTRVWRFSPNSTMHDIALNSRSEVAFDRSGNVWLTLINKNRLGRLDVETGETAEFDMPVPEGTAPGTPAFNIALYGAAMASDRRTVWFSQLNGDLAAFDTETLEVTTKVTFPRGTGPRRMGIDDDDVLYVPLTGAGQLFVYDARQKEALGTYDLPDRNSYPYVAVWDPGRKVVWIGTGNSDVIYQFDPKTKQFLEFPLPRRGAYLRRIVVVPTTGDIWTSYASFPAEKGPADAVVLTPGEPGQ